MRKIYSLVLMAAALLVGTNVWADVRSTQQTDENDPTISLDEAKISKDGGSTWMYATTLKEAFDYVENNETAEIVLLRGVPDMDKPITMPKTVSPTILSGVCQNITLNLNNWNISATEHVTPFRLVKGTLNITGEGVISKGSVGKNVWEGGAVITVWGTADKTASNWSNLSIGPNVTISIASGTTEGTGIIIQDHNTTPKIGTAKYTDDPLAVSAETPSVLTAKYGFCTYYDESSRWKDLHYTQDQATAEMEALIGNGNYPLECGALYNNGTNGFLQGAAFGVKINIEGTIIAGKRPLQIIGHVNQKPSCTEPDEISKRDPARYPNAPYYLYQYPYINIASTAHLESSNAGGCTGIYAAGYGVFDIAGEVYGATGIYMKAGDVKLIDADIRSTSTANTPSNGGASGVNNAGGSAIAIESNDAYAGGSGLNITGDTKVTGNGGYAIYEQTYMEDTDGDGNKDANVSHITIEGGTIEGGNAGAIAITDETKEQEATQVTGGNISAQEGTSTVSVGEGGTATTIEVTDLFPNNTGYHTTEVTTNGKTTVVVSEGAGPTTEQTQNTWGSIASLDEGSNAAWTGTGNPADPGFATSNGCGVITSGTVKLGELQIISGTSATNQQILTIQNGATLDVRHLMMNDYAQIIVEAGGKLIVEGTQGIVAPKTSCIVLKATNDNYAQFLFNPDVTSNRHPKATIELISDSYRVSATNRHNQHFGIPTAFELENIVTDREERVAFFSYDYSTESWTSIGSLYYATDPLDKSILKDPFGYYQMLCVSATEGTKVTMTGNLVGNDNHEMSYLAHYYMGFANSYTADIDMATLFPTIPGSNKAVYVYQLEGEQDENPQYVWKANTSVYKPVSKIAPMQAFVILNRGAANTSILNYNNMVWTPAQSGSGAPTRQSSYDGMIDIRVSSSNAVDYVTLLEDSRFTSEFEEGEAEKYMNADANIYVSDEMPLSIFATNDMNNTYLGFSCVNGGTYTMKFNSIVGDNYVLVDLLTNATTHIVEGATYTFDAANGETNDYRFQIRKIANVVTDMETVETNGPIQKLGVYTITGQYVGTMNVWNELPSGIYIVDGEKRVK